MQDDSSREMGKKAAAWLATCFVVAGGLMTCVILSFTFWDDPKLPLAATVLLAKKKPPPRPDSASLERSSSAPTVRLAASA